MRSNQPPNGRRTRDQLVWCSLQPRWNITYSDYRLNIMYSCFKTRKQRKQHQVHYQTPRIKTYQRGDDVWNPWWRTTILVQSTNTLPLPSVSDTPPRLPTDRIPTSSSTVGDAQNPRLHGFDKGSRQYLFTG
jgi:hypothetical protein